MHSDFGPAKLACKYAADLFKSVVNLNGDTPMPTDRRRRSQCIFVNHNVFVNRVSNESMAIILSRNQFATSMRRNARLQRICCRFVSIFFAWFRCHRQRIRFGLGNEFGGIVMVIIFRSILFHVVCAHKWKTMLRLTHEYVIIPCVTIGRAAMTQIHLHRQSHPFLLNDFVFIRNSLPSNLLCHRPNAPISPMRYWNYSSKQDEKYHLTLVLFSRK